MSDVARPPGRRVDQLALLTFVLASLWLLGVGSLAALFVGRRSLRRMKREPGLRGRTVTWVGIALAIFGLILAALWITLALMA